MCVLIADLLPNQNYNVRLLLIRRVIRNDYS